jgi:hypothetical protein
MTDLHIFILAVLLSGFVSNLIIIKKMRAMRDRIHELQEAIKPDGVWHQALKERFENIDEVIQDLYELHDHRQL